MESSRSAAARLGAGTPVRSMKDLPAASLWLVSSNDESIPSIAEELAETGVLRAGDVVFHCSGAMSSDVLQPVRRRGALVGSVHPIRSFADPELAASHFPGTYCALEGDEGARFALEDLFAGLDARVFVIPTAAKMLCHAGHVFSSNYVVTVLAVAQKLYAAAGIPEELASAFVAPLVQGSVENFLRVGGVNALTGPISRAEVPLIAEQRRQLAEISQSLGELYGALGAHALELAVAQGLSAEQADAVAHALGRGH